MTTYLCAYVDKDGGLVDVRAVNKIDWSDNRALGRIKLPPNADIGNRLNDNWSYDWDAKRFVPPAPTQTDGEGGNRVVKSVLEVLLAVYKVLDAAGHTPDVDDEDRKILVGTLKSLRQAARRGIT